MVQQLEWWNGEIAAMGFFWNVNSCPCHLWPQKMGWEGGFTRRFMFHIRSNHLLQLHIRLSLPFPHNLIPHLALLSLPLPITRHIFPPCAPLYIYYPLPLPQNIGPPHAPLYLPICFPHHIRPACAPLSIFIPLHLPQLPCLSQHFPCCNSYPNII